MSSALTLQDLQVNGDGDGESDSQSGSRHGGAHVDEGEQAPARKKRRRQKNSCLPCQRRKTKCDKEDPCSACTKRNESELCLWDIQPLVGPVPHDIAAEFSAMKRRLARLERQVAMRPESSTAKKPDSPIAASSSSLPNSFTMNSSVYNPSFSPASSSGASHHLPPLPEVQDGPNSLKNDRGATPPPYSNKIDAEAEEAVQALEDLALGRREFLSLGRNAGDVPSVGKMVFSNGSEARESSSPSIPMSGAYTTILLNAKKAVRSVFVTRSRQESALLECLPERAISDALVEEFFREIGWVYPVLHRPTFEAECRELWACMANGEYSRIDPAWLSIYWMVLTWSVSTLGRATSQVILCHYPESEIKKLPEIWYDAAEKALYQSDFAGRPQVRAVQAMCLKLSYQRTTPESEHLDTAASFFVWLATATRICQLLGLHRLGSDPRTMPRDDPAWPRQACCLKRELAKRIWSFVVSFEWLYCSGQSGGQLLPHHFDTDAPLNVDDDDLGLELLVQERPADYLTDLSFCRAKFAIAKHQISAKIVSDTHPTVAYSTVLELDAELQKEVKAIEMTREGSNPRRKLYHRALLLALVHNRVLRLHRPFFMRGWSDPTFQPSSEKALHSATEISIGLERMVTEEGSLEHLWFTYPYGMGAVMVIFLNMLREERDPAARGTSAEKRDLILGVRKFFVQGVQQGDSTSGLLKMSLQAIRILDHLLISRQRSSLDNVRDRTLPVAAIFREIAKTINLPESTASTSLLGSSQGGSSPQAQAATSTPGWHNLLLSMSPDTNIMSSTLLSGNTGSLDVNMADFFVGDGYDLSAPGNTLGEPFGDYGSRAAVLGFQQSLPLPHSALSTSFDGDNWEQVFSQVAQPEGY